MSEAWDKRQMNTIASKERIEVAVQSLMMTDGFGPDEVLAHTASYSVAIFGNDTKTGRLRIKECAQRMLREARKG